jgi:uncharacterized protein
MDMTTDFLTAVKEGNLPFVEQMAARNPGLVNAKAPSGVSALMLATYFGESAVAAYLIEQGAVLDIFDAAATGKVNRVRELVSEDPTRVNAYSVDGFQPLGLASFFGHFEVVDYLLQSGAEVNSPSKNSQRVMPLHSSVAGQHLEVSRILLEHGANVNAKQADDFSPLHEAVQNGQVEMVQLLLLHGADRYAQKSDGQTPVAMADEKAFSEIAALLKMEVR